MEKNFLVLGLTGQTGAGKTTVSRWLSAQGLPIVDADLVAREVVEKGKPCLGELVEEFSAGILLEDGGLDRRHLGRIVFSDPEKLKALNRITFPHILKSIEEKLAVCKASGAAVAVLDAPTLFESGCDRFCNAIACVVAPYEVRLGRIMARDTLSEEDARTRMNAQFDEAFYTKRCRFILENTGDFAELEPALSAMLSALNEEIGA